jgi:hypothetical protein
MRIAIIGNSHLAALKVAVRDGLFRTGEPEITFWGTGGYGFNTISYEGGQFRTPLRDFVLKVSDGRYESLPAHDFDAIIFHGVLLNVGRYLSSLRKTSEDLRCYSRACLREGLQMCIEDAPTYPLVRSLRTDYDRRVLISPMPLMSEDDILFKERSVRAEEFEVLNSCIAGIFSDIGAEYVAQPSDTVRDYKCTKREFCVNSVGLIGDLSIKHPNTDHLHMNGQYGARVLEEIAARLSVGEHERLFSQSCDQVL